MHTACCGKHRRAAEADMVGEAMCMSCAHLVHEITDDVPLLGGADRLAVGFSEDVTCTSKVQLSYMHSAVTERLLLLLCRGLTRSTTPWCT